jgi:KDO2-lipid IV(A) lauroyltransferase
MPPLRKRLRFLTHPLEYVAAAGGLQVIDRLPVSAAAALAGALADAWFALNRRRRAIAMRNIMRAGLADDPDAASRLARASFRHFAVLVIESLKSAQGFTEQDWRERIELDVPESTWEVLREPGRGVILASGHFGNWEVAAQILSFTKPVVGITRPMNNPYIERLVQKRKPRHRFRLTPKHDANPARLLHVLAGGEVLALMIDQHARAGAVQVDFFGVPSATHASPAMLHLVTRAPLCFGCCVRTGLMRFRLIAEPPLRFTPTGSREADVQAVLQALNTRLERAVRRHPEQYLWAHRRWRD